MLVFLATAAVLELGVSIWLRMNGQIGVQAQNKAPEGSKEDIPREEADKQGD